MISFQDFRQTDDTPIYLQIVRYIQQGLAAGAIQDGDELPSRRVVSALLASESQHRAEGFQAAGGRGAGHVPCRSQELYPGVAAQIEALRQAMLEREMQAMVDAARRMGLSREEAHRLLDALYDKEGAEV